MRWIALFALIVLPACATCQTYYRYDGGASPRPYYRLDVCRNRDGSTSSTLVCDSTDRLPNATCK
jgi:hypothetical protein